MTNWQGEILRDGVTTKQKRAIFEILEAVPVANWGTIMEGLNKRKVKRFQNKNIRRFLNNSPEIDVRKDRFNNAEYRLRR